MGQLCRKNNMFLINNEDIFEDDETIHIYGVCTAPLNTNTHETIFVLSEFVVYI